MSTRIKQTLLASGLVGGSLLLAAGTAGGGHAKVHLVGRYDEARADE